MGTAALLAALSACSDYNTTSGPRLGTSILSWTFPTGPGPVSGDPFARGVPPSVLGQPHAPAPPASDLTGAYSGEAAVTFNPGQESDCTDLTIHGGLIVNGRQASLLTFSGVVQPDGQLVMQAGDKWISGRFIGRTFSGILLRRFPACAWTLTLASE